MNSRQRLLTVLQGGIPDWVPVAPDFSIYQCGRDTPFENLYAMIETARSYGRYA